MPKIKGEQFVRYFPAVLLSENGRIILPKEYCTAQNLEAGSLITILSIGNCLMLLPERKKFSRQIKKIEKTLVRLSVTEKQIVETLPETRREIFEELYPNLFDME